MSAALACGSEEPEPPAPSAAAITPESPAVEATPTIAEVVTPTPGNTMTPPPTTVSPTAVAAMAPPARERAVVPSGSAAVEIDRGNFERREIAVTFDCGATANGTAEI